MYRKVINFDKSSYIELASRIDSTGSNLMLALRGPKNDREITVASILLKDQDIRQLILYFEEWLQADKTNPVKV